MSLSQNDTKTLILADRNLSQTYRTSQEDLAIQGYKQYLGIRKKLDEKDKRSNLHIPVSYRITDTIRSREVKAICGNRPYVDPVVKPGANANPDLMMQNEAKAKVSAALLDQQLVTNEFISLVYDWATAKLIFPTSIIGVGWKYQEEKRKKRVPLEIMGIKFPHLVTREEMEVLYDDNELIYVDLCDYWPDPWGLSQNVKNHRFGIHREWKTQDDIESELEFYKSQGAGKVYMPTKDNWKAIQEIQANDNRFQRFSEVDQVVPSNDGIDSGSSKPGNNSKNRRYAVYKHWTRNELKIMINDSFVPFVGDNPFWRHKQIPFAMQSFERMPGEVYGRSALYFIHHLQEEVNTQRNNRIDNVALIINCMWKYRKGLDVDETTLVSKPGGMIPLTDLNDIAPIVVPDATSSSVREDQIVIREMEDTLGSPAIVQGLEGSNSQTATEIQSQNSNASIRIDVKLELNAEAFERVFGLMDMNNQQFITEKRLVSMFDDTGSKLWKEVGPLDIVGFERDYTLASAKVDPAASKEFRRQQYWNTIVEGKKAGLQLDYNLLAIDYLKLLDLPNPSKYQITPEKLQEIANQSMQENAAQQNALAQQEQAKNQQQFQQDIIKIVLQTIGKIVEKNPVLLMELQNMEGLIEQAPLEGGEQQSMT